MPNRVSDDRLKQLAQVYAPSISLQERVMMTRELIFLRAADAPEVKWEAFEDPAYYYFWAVRPVGETRWGYCFHLHSKEEAEGLRDLLNKETPHAEPSTH